MLVDSFRRGKQIDGTYDNRIKTSAKGKLTRTNLRRGVVMGWNIIWQIGVQSTTAPSSGAPPGTP